ncbi:hypothetical protein M422DRAFT_245578 [Sphaerobolus stellatus SS14]|nr:hypothetical protein M422DRAFT_245578 [Sphaerobolus stellatus SS14]
MPCNRFPTDVYYIGHWVRKDFIKVSIEDMLLIDYNLEEVDDVFNDIPLKALQSIRALNIDRPYIIDTENLVDFIQRFSNFEVLKTSQPIEPDFPIILSALSKLQSLRALYVQGGSKPSPSQELAFCLHSEYPPPLSSIMCIYFDDMSAAKLNESLSTWQFQINHPQSGYVFLPEEMSKVTDIIRSSWNAAGGIPGKNRYWNFPKKQVQDDGG